MLELLVLAQSSSPWLTPGAVYTALALLAGAILWGVRQAFYVWRVRQDLDALRHVLFGDAQTPGAFAQLRSEVDARLRELTGSLERYTTREGCASCRREMDEARRESVSKAHETIRELEARVVAGEKDALELRGDLKSALKALDRLTAMVAQVQSDVSAIAIHQRKPLGRQPTGPIPDEEG